MKTTVGTTAVRLDLEGYVTPVIQNLGPGTLYLDRAADVTVGTGLQVPIGAVYEFPGDINLAQGDIWMIADAVGTDVRYMAVS